MSKGLKAGSDGVRCRLETMKAKYGESCFSGWGKKTTEKHDPEYYRKLSEMGGSIGGNATLAKYGHEHYVELGKKSAQKRKEMRESEQAS